MQQSRRQFREADENYRANRGGSRQRFSNKDFERDQYNRFDSSSDDQMNEGYYGGDYQGNRHGNLSSNGYRGGSQRSQNGSQWDQYQDYQGRNDQQYNQRYGEWNRPQANYQDRQRNQDFGSGSTMGYNSMRGSNYGTGNYESEGSYGSSTESVPSSSYRHQGYTGSGASEYSSGNAQGRSDYAAGSVNYGWESRGTDGYDQANNQTSNRGKYFGQGPKGYTRSDDRIKEDVSQALMDAHDVDASEIEVQVEQGNVTLTGTVTERRMKRLAEDCVEHIRGVKDVTNQIRVVSSSTSRGTPSSESAPGGSSLSSAGDTGSRGESESARYSQNGSRKTSYKS